MAAYRALDPLALRPDPLPSSLRGQAHVDVVLKAIGFETPILPSNE
jgi:hypothetical protein